MYGRKESSPKDRKAERRNNYFFVNVSVFRRLRPTKYHASHIITRMYLSQLKISETLMTVTMTQITLYNLLIRVTQTPKMTESTEKYERFDTIQRLNSKISRISNDFEPPTTH
jgi:hypothetical protein